MGKSDRFLIGTNSENGGLCRLGIAVGLVRLGRLSESSAPKADGLAGFG